MCLSRTLLQFAVAFSICFLAAVAAVASDVRERTRPVNPAGTAVSADQAQSLTLTLTPASVRTVQTWLRTAGTVGDDNRKLSAVICSDDAKLLSAGQRARATPLESRSSMYQARVSRVTSKDGCGVLELTLSGQARAGSRDYLLEVIVDRGELLSVPNEAIIEEEGRRLVYVQVGAAAYLPREITAGIQGELYTQILSGVEPGDQVVTIGSFFIDSEFKMKGAR